MAEDFAVDAVLTALAKAGPEGLTKDEIEGETKLGTEDLRSALKYVLDEGMVRENGSRIVVASKPVSGVEEGGQEEPQEGVAEPRTVPEGAGGGLLARTELDVRVTFAVEDGKRTVDERAVEGARTLATDLMNLWPSLDVNVEVREVAVFAEPRRVWPPENDGS